MAETEDAPLRCDAMELGLWQEGLGHTSLRDQMHQLGATKIKRWTRFGSAITRRSASFPFTKAPSVSRQLHEV
jgi:hypothetical protein